MRRRIIAAIDRPARHLGSCRCGGPIDCKRGAAIPPAICCSRQRCSSPPQPLRDLRGPFGGQPRPAMPEPLTPRGQAAAQQRRVSHRLSFPPRPESRCQRCCEREEEGSTIMATARWLSGGAKTKARTATVRLRGQAREAAQCQWRTPEKPSSAEALSHASSGGGVRRRGVNVTRRHRRRAPAAIEGTARGWGCCCCCDPLPVDAHSRPAGGGTAAPPQARQLSGLQ